MFWSKFCSCVPSIIHQIPRLTYFRSKKVWADSLTNFTALFLNSIFRNILKHNQSSSVVQCLGYWVSACFILYPTTWSCLVSGVGHMTIQHGYDFIIGVIHCWSQSGNKASGGSSRSSWTNLQYVCKNVCILNDISTVDGEGGGEGSVHSDIVENLVRVWGQTWF